MPGTDIERERIDKARELTNAVQDGKLPTTAQLVDGLQQAQKSTTLHEASRDLTPAGKKVLADAERILDTTTKILTQNNANNELQNAIYYGNRAASNRDLSINESEANDAANRLVQAGATSAQLAKTIVTSSEFRTLLNDISGIAQDILRSNILDASDDLANDPNAPEEVRKAAAQARDKVGAHSSLEGAAKDVKQEAEQKVEEGKQKVQQEKNSAEGQANNAQREAKEVGNETYHTAGQSLQSGASLRETAKNIIDTVADQAEARLPEDRVNQASDAIRNQGAQLYSGEKTSGDLKNQAQSQAQGYINQAKDVAKQTQSQLKDPNSQLRQTTDRVAGKLANLTPEQRDDIIRRLKSVAKTIQSKPEFQQGIEDIVSLLRPLAHQAKDVSKTAVEVAATAPEDPHQLDASKDSRLAIANAKQLIENFANGKSLDPLIKSLREFAAEAKDDEELNAYWHDLAAYLTRTVREAGYAENSNYEKDASDLVDRSRKVLEKYEYHTQNIGYEARSFSHALAKNKVAKRLQSDTQQLINDLFLDEKGKPTFKPELLRDLAKTIPTIADKLAYLPIPRVEADDGTYHMIFDNIILHSTILPKYVRILTDTIVDATAKKPEDQFNNEVTVEIAKIEASARDIAWLMNKHSGFWKAGDVGLADFDIKGDGLTLRIKFTPGSELAEPSADGRFLNVSEVNATLHHLDLRLHDSHHDFLYKIAKPMINRTAKKQIENAIEKNLKDVIYSIDQKIAAAAANAGVGEGPKPVEGIPEWGSKAFDPKVHP